MIMMGALLISFATNSQPSLWQLYLNKMHTSQGVSVSVTDLDLLPPIVLPSPQSRERGTVQQSDPMLLTWLISVKTVKVGYQDSTIFHLKLLYLHCHNKADDSVTGFCEQLAWNGCKDDNGQGMVGKHEGSSPVA